MQYKTITLQLLEDHPELHERLRAARRLLEALEVCSTDLRTRHLALADSLSNSQPGRNQTQVSSESFEIAVAELLGRIRAASLPDEPLSLDELMDHLQDRTPPA